MQKFCCYQRVNNDRNVMKFLYIRQGYENMNEKYSNFDVELDDNDIRMDSFVVQHNIRLMGS